MIAEPFRHNFELLSFGKCLQYDSAFTAINFFFGILSILLSLSFCTLVPRCQILCPCQFRLRQSHTAELHLNPEPNASCRTRWPFFWPIWERMYSSSYQMEDEDVLPYLREKGIRSLSHVSDMRDIPKKHVTYLSRVFRLGSTCSCVSFKLSPTPSTTARPPA